jgi:hypothetical protein
LHAAQTLHAPAKLDFPAVNIPCPTSLSLLARFLLSFHEVITSSNGKDVW